MDYRYQFYCFVNTNNINTNNTNNTSNKAYGDMENLILEPIRHIKEMGRKRVSLDNIMNRIKKTSATIMDNKSLTFELEQMITKGLIDQNYKILITENKQINTEPSPDKISCTCEGSNTDQEVAITNESLPLTVSQDTPVTKTKSNATCKNIESADKSSTICNSQTTSVIKTTSDTSCHFRKSPAALDIDKLTANMMAIKSFFMNEIYELRQEISSLQLKLQQEKFNQSGNNHVSEKDENIIFEKFKNQIGVLSKRKSTIKR